MLNVALGWAKNEGSVDALVLHPTLQMRHGIVGLSNASIDLIQPVDKCIFPEIRCQRFVEVGLESMQAFLEVGQLSHPELVRLGFASRERLLHLGECLVKQLWIIIELWHTLCSLRCLICRMSHL